MNTATRETAGVGRRGGAGYTLVELMTALGILAIALPMVGAAFLSGMVENQESVQTTMATMVAENALAVVRARVSHRDLVLSGWGPGATQPLEIPREILKREDLTWTPFKRGSAGELAQDEEETWVYGCVVVAQRMVANENDYRLVAIPFKKFREDDTIADGGVKVVFDGNGQVTTCEVKFERPAGQSVESAHLSFLVVRTALRPVIEPIPDI